MKLIEFGSDLMVLQEKPCKDNYPEAIKALIYCIVERRLDISFALCALARHVEDFLIGC